MARDLVRPLVRGIAAGLGDFLVFDALQMDIASKEIRGVLKGVGDLTEGRSSTIYQRDWEDFWRSWESGEPAWFGGRKVENKIIQSDDMTIAPWAEQDNAIATATTLTFTADAGSGIKQVISGAAQKGIYRLSVYIWGDDAETFNLELVDNADGSDSAVTPVTVTPVRTRYSVLMDNSSSSTFGGSLGIFINRSGVLTNGAVVNFDNWQVEQVNGQADQTPSEYVPTTTVAAHKIFGTDRSGVPFASLPWLYGGPAGTNELTFSRDLTDAAWTETGTAVAAFDAIGLEGVANTASTLTDDDGAAFESVEDIVTITDDSNTHTARVFLKKDADETRFPSFAFLLQGGSTAQNISVDVNSKTGAGVNRASVGTVALEVNDAGLWWEVLAEVTNNATGNVTATVRIFPAVGTVIGTPDVAATGSIIVGNVELHLNKTIEQVRGSTPIFTSGSTVSVDGTDLSFDDANHDDLEGAYFCEFKNVGLNVANTGGIVGLGVGGRPLFTSTAAVNFRTFDGVTGAGGPAITLDADDVEYKIALAYGSSLMRVNTDGSWGTADTYDGVYNNTNNKLDILHNTSFQTRPTAVMLLRNLRRYDLDYENAQSQIDELMAA